MEDNQKALTMKDRAIAVLEGEKPNRMPFIDRLEIWYGSKRLDDSLPERFRDMSLEDVYKAVGMGRQKFSAPYAFKLYGVEVTILFENEVLFHESEPVFEYFPAQWAPEQIPRDREGSTIIEFKTPVGKLWLRYEVVDSSFAMSGAEPYLKEHLIKEIADYRTVEYIIERAEIVPRFEKISQEEIDLGDNGLVVPVLHRIPFQQLLLEYLGEIQLFHALYDSPQLIDRLIHLLDTQLLEILTAISELPSLYVEFGDNLHGMITNPKLFAQYCLPHYQKYTEILHGQGKKVGSHTDGDLKLLLDLLAESGLDVCESFSPAPLTSCTFDEAWHAWRKGPLIWGGFPSSILEERTEVNEFKEHVHRTLETVGNQNIIWGVGDMVLGNNLIERIEYISAAIENRS